ncbi:type II toxin-antitoxin system PemK/MazF family toxin [Planomonospora sp. ID91781]|uniref:type II toxin-antitoxin system PemK/MazF family toxin n=1 Tax=Planomonospora sp. ID91781 TaxID=2738135 RepID=UPI0018C39BE1|nr:type II toxin-antitoxin system PemK/MazF family toxin [Planomonospora sp. ID91781]MBG0824370.1 type II toxin-antitoxin system PemK/MazF family toxin [Planomonospora sp. ID91781]
MSRVLPWQIWPVDFGTPVGSEQRGRRPALVVASDLHCRFPIDMTLVVPLTTRDRGLSHHVLISSPASGLRQRSWARIEDITSISTHRLVSDGPLGCADEGEIRTVQRWLRRLVAV